MFKNIIPLVIINHIQKWMKMYVLGIFSQLGDNQSTKITVIWWILCYQSIKFIIIYEIILFSNYLFYRLIFSFKSNCCKIWSIFVYAMNCLISYCDYIQSFLLFLQIFLLSWMLGCRRNLDSGHEGPTNRYNCTSATKI